MNVAARYEDSIRAFCGVNSADCVVPCSVTIACAIRCATNTTGAMVSLQGNRTAHRVTSPAGNRRLGSGAPKLHAAPRISGNAKLVMCS